MSESAKQAGKRTASDAGLDALVSTARSSKHHDTDSPSNLETKPGVSNATDLRGVVRKLHNALDDNQKAGIEQQAERVKKALKNDALNERENLQRKYREEQARVEMINKLKMEMMDELMLSGKAELKKELEHDVREELKTELTAELRDVVYADYAKEYEQHKQAKALELEKELVPVVKEQLVVEFTKGVYLELRMEMGQDQETRAAMRAELKADMAEEVKEELIKELAPGITAELRKDLAPAANHDHSTNIISSGHDEIAGSVNGIAYGEESTSEQQDQAAKHIDQLHDDVDATLQHEQPVKNKDANVTSGSEKVTVTNEHESGAEHLSAEHFEDQDSANKLANNGPTGQDSVRDVHHSDGSFAAISQNEENISYADDRSAAYAGDGPPLADNPDNHHVSLGASLNDYEDQADISQEDNDAANQLGTKDQANQNIENAFDSYPTQRRMSDNTGTSKDDPIELDSDSDDEAADEQDNDTGYEDEEEEYLFPAAEGLHITYDGYVADIYGDAYGVLTTDNLREVVGFAVNDMGDVLDHQGRVVGQADPFEPTPDESEAQDDGHVDRATRYAGHFHQGNNYENAAEQYEDDEEEEEYASDSYGEYGNLARYQHGSISPVDTEDEIDEAARSMGYGPARSSSAPVAPRSGEYEDTPTSTYGQPAFYPVTSTSSGPYHQAAQRDPSRYQIDENYDEDYEDLEDPETTLVEDDLPATIDETQVLGLPKEKSLFLNSDSDSD